jgi:hypothetical protein
MERVGRAVGVVLRPNSSLAGVWGSSGLASGGSGWGLRIPLSLCACHSAREKCDGAQCKGPRAIPSHARTRVRCYK